MAKVTLSTITSGYVPISLINSNFSLIAAAIENTLSRDGTSPNTMSASLDMNSQRLINLAAPLSLNDAARLTDVQSAVLGTFTNFAVAGTLTAGVNVSSPLVTVATSTITPAIQSSGTFTAPITFYCGSSGIANGTQILKLLGNAISNAQYVTIKNDRNQGLGGSNQPLISLDGPDTDIDMGIRPKGAGKFTLLNAIGFLQLGTISAVPGFFANADTYFYDSSGSTQRVKILSGGLTIVSGSLFTPIVDSGAGSSVFIKTNSGTTQGEITHTASATSYPTFTGSTTGFPMICTSAGSLLLSSVASPRDGVTVTASAGNQTLNVTTGKLVITPQVAVSGSNIQIGTNPGVSGGVGIPYSTQFCFRDSSNTFDVNAARCETRNSVTNTVRLGGSGSGCLLVARSGAGVPTTSDIPSGDWMLWRDTSGATTKLYYNNAGSLQSVTLA